MAGTERRRLGDWEFLSITVGLVATIGQLEALVSMTGVSGGCLGGVGRKGRVT